SAGGLGLRRMPPPTELTWHDRAAHPGSRDRAPRRRRRRRPRRPPRLPAPAQRVPAEADRAAYSPGARAGGVATLEATLAEGSGGLAARGRATLAAASESDSPATLRSATPLRRSKTRRHARRFGEATDRAPRAAHRERGTVLWHS